MCCPVSGSSESSHFSTKYPVFTTTGAESGSPHGMVSYVVSGIPPLALNVIWKLLGFHFATYSTSWSGTVASTAGFQPFMSYPSLVTVGGVIGLPYSIYWLHPPVPPFGLNVTV